MGNHDLKEFSIFRRAFSKRLLWIDFFLKNEELIHGEYNH